MKLSDVLTLVGVVVVGGLQLAYLREEAATRAPLPAVNVPAPRPAPASVVPAAVAAQPPPAPASAPEAPAAPPVPLLGDQWLAATVDALLENQPDLKLTADEVAGLKEVYGYCQTVRTSFEADIAEVLSLTGTHARLRIPPYPVAGARLQQMFHDELKAELGEERYGDVDDHLGDTFEIAFKWFGAAVQVLDVELKRDPTEGLLYRIVARMDFADTVDPELGQNETRLFSTTSQYALKPETVATGEWRPLARHFPRLPDPATAGR
jgi:hypothetical protein